MSRTILATVGIVSFLVLGHLGCSKPPVPTEVSTDTPENRAREVLAKSFDSWVAGESSRNFEQANPGIKVWDQRRSMIPFGRPCIEARVGNLDKPTVDLHDYEIISAREPAAGQKAYAFMVLLTLQAGDRETFARKVEYQVTYDGNSEVKWSIFGVPEE